MALPEITNVFRITINFDNAFGITPRSIFHVYADTFTEGEVGAALWGNAPEGLCTAMHNQFEPTSLTVLALDGVSAGLEVPRPDGVPDWCLNDAQIIAEGCCVLKISTGIRGPKGRGRMFQGPIGEGTNENGFIAGDALGTGVRWEEFRVALELVDVVLGVASYKHAEFNPAVGFSVNPRVGIQQRRLHQLG